MEEWSVNVLFIMTYLLHCCPYIPHISEYRVKVKNPYRVFLCVLSLNAPQPNVGRKPVLVTINEDESSLSTHGNRHETYHRSKV